MVFKHTPVLLNAVIQALDPKPGEFFIDGTFGGGGHAREILNKIGPSGKLLAVDWDEKSFQEHAISDSRVVCEVGNYADLPEILTQKGLPKADGLLLDLGFSSEQLVGGRGFSFNPSIGGDEPSLMTYSKAAKPVREILKEISEEELARVIKEFGQERFAQRIARAIKSREIIRPIETAGDLSAVISRAVPKGYERGRIHPATRTFQALRIYANHELDNLERALRNLGAILRLGGRAVIISFHSLEDRLVKNYFRDLEKVGQLKILTKKPIVASQEEIKQNPRARSAKLRAVKII